jgi:hypothetical protein
MAYEYSGYMQTILWGQGAPECKDLDSVEFTVEDLAKWPTKDYDSDKEWQRIPVNRTVSEGAVRLVGQFNDVRQMDSLTPDDPSFWVPMSSLGWEDDRFPIDLDRYPMAEITYRCTSDNAQPMWLWTYPGGLHADALPKSRRWRTLARRVQHSGFPKQLDALILRLYSTARSTESIEVKSIRFRAMTPEELEATAADRLRLEQEARPLEYPILDEFLPVGVHMDAETARRLAEMLGISLTEYWTLVLEDLVTHHHNCIALDSATSLTATEWQELLSLCEGSGIKIVAGCGLRIEDEPEQLRERIEKLIGPHADSLAVLAWRLRNEPSEADFQNLVTARKLVEEVDRNHPVCVSLRHPSAFPLYAPHFSVSGFSRYTSHAPWEFGEMIHEHVPLAGGQHFWAEGPGYIYATGTPEWSTSPEMRLMVNLAFANGARGFFTYAYHNDPIWVSGSCQRSLTGPFLTFSDLWLELDRRMERCLALAPLLLRAKPVRLPKMAFITSSSSEDFTHHPEGVAPTASYRLRGPDFELYFVVSNDVRGMSSVNVHIPTALLRGLEIYDLADFVQSRTWAPMDLERHMEMFPGQAHVVIVAKPEVCAHWRDVIASRLVDDDHRQLRFNMELAWMYDLDIKPVEALLKRVNTGAPLKDLEIMDAARDRLVDLIYTCPPIYQTRGQIISASSAVCACDGALCRLMSRGKIDLAREWGLKVVPLAREIANARLELRRGRGAEIAPHCDDLANRSIRLATEIRMLA